jgi:hypothetical protein
LSLVSQKNKRDDALFLLILVIVFYPRTVLSTIDGLSSVLRVDILVSLFLVIFYAITLKPVSVFSRRSFVFGSLVFILSLYYIIISPRPSVSIGQLLLYFSLFFSFTLGASVTASRKTRYIRILRAGLAVNIIVHFMNLIFGWPSILSYFVNDRGLEEAYSYIGIYGISNMPFQFAIYVVCYIYLLLDNRNSRSNFRAAPGLLGASFALALGDSRVSLLAIMISILGLKFFLSLPVAILLSQMFQVKALSVFGDLSSLYLDESLGMRGVNLLNYIDWLTPSKFMLGAGAQSFLQYSTQYGQPGPLDMGYLRVLTEFGIVGTVALFFSIRHHIKSKFVLRSSFAVMVLIIFAAIYSVVNEGLLASRSGHLFFFVFGLLGFNKTYRG